MTMEQQRLTWLLDRQLAGTVTPDEIQELDDFLRSDVNSELFTSILAEKMQAQSPIPPADPLPWQNMPERIMSIDKPTPQKVIPLYRRPFIRWTAAAAVLLTIATWIIARRERTASIATFFQESRTTISTARGQQRELTLPDGTHVWLNAGSTLSYPMFFDVSKRSVELTGEAFFDVQHADKAPFLVHTGNITTTVLGTSFDISAYPQAAFKASVLTGKIRVQDNTQTFGILEKGNRLTVLDDVAALQKYIDTAAMAVWRTGALIYRDETLADIVADLQRNFSDSIVIANPALRTMGITLSTDKDLGIKATLDMIARTTGAHITFKNGIYTIE
jgi:ferric-dicitrate binding protein FerR (iron transport regulator)